MTAPRKSFARDLREAVADVVAAHGTRADLKVADVVAELEALLADWRAVVVERRSPPGGGT